MIKLFEFLFSGCWHHWEDWDKNGVADANNTVIGYAVFCRCSKCGRHRRFNLF